MDNWFTIDEIDANTYIISEYRHWEETHCYLLNGNTRSLLIDTWLGISNIYEEVLKLTDKPITAAATHIHWDHIGGHKRVTAANASGINDGAAAIILASGEAVEKYGLKPMAKLIGWGQGGVDPKIMGVGPVPASRQAMAKAGVTIDDIDLIEANEAFAAQSIAVGRELGFDMAKVNVNGGAIALGHPVGASGARIIVTLLHEMQKRDDAKKGLATLCIGGGMGVATVFEKC